MHTASRSPFRNRSAALLVALAAAFACVGGGGDSARFDPAHDDPAMAAIASRWSGAELDLSLCEDTERSAAWTAPDDRHVEHVVRGGGLGRVHEEESEEGCGGCNPGAVAYVRGTASGALGTNVAVSGIVWLRSTSSGAPYAFPYQIEVACDETPTPCAITGTLGADGTVSATVVIGGRRPRARGGRPRADAHRTRRLRLTQAAGRRAGDHYGSGDPQNRGPHFNDPAGNHYDD